jgi:hypothetical protein
LGFGRKVVSSGYLCVLGGRGVVCLAAVFLCVRVDAVVCLGALG